METTNISLPPLIRSSYWKVIQKAKLCIHLYGPLVGEGIKKNSRRK